MIFWLACAEDPPVRTMADVDWQGDARWLEPQPAPRLLRRMSLDLRGVLPSEAELDAVEADPARVTEFRDVYLEDPRFEERLVALLAERWNTVQDSYEVGIKDYFLPDETADTFVHSVGEEPLRLIARVIAEDRPYSEIVTADWTMSNELLSAYWPVDYPDGTGWQPSRYTDRRPAAGVLSTNGMWWRYVTNQSNMSRGRVAVVSRLLLCTDILARPVRFIRTEAVSSEEALRTNPACLTCHSAVDPAAATLFGYWWLTQYNPYEMQTYHAEREPLGPRLLGTEPGWYGTPIDGLVDLGDEIAADPRFVRCGAESFATQLWRRDVRLEDFGRIEDLRQGFVASGLNARDLIRAVTDTPEYQAGGIVEGAPAEVAGRERVERLLSPNQLKTVLAEEAGFEWTYQGYEQLENDVLGHRVLRGGVNGYSATRVQQDMGLTWTLVNTRVAEAAAEKLERRFEGSPSRPVPNSRCSTPSWRRCTGGGPGSAPIPSGPSRSVRYGSASTPRMGRWRRGRRW
jgi:hypothetical protein